MKNRWIATNTTNMGHTAIKKKGTNMPAIIMPAVTNSEQKISVSTLLSNFWTTKTIEAT